MTASSTTTMTVDRFALLLGRLERLNEEAMSDACNRHAISPAEFRVLTMLREVGASVRPATIARWVVQTTGGLSATLRRLERDGRIVRSDDPDDRRGKRVAITPAGLEFCARVQDDVSDRYRLALDGLDLASISDSVVQLVTSFERFGNHPISSTWAESAAS